MFDTSLLPAADTSLRCAVHAEVIGLHPGGSAFFVDEIIVVDVVRPWPKPVWAADGFTAVPELVMAAAEAGRRVRVLAAVGDEASNDGASNFAAIVVHRRVSGTGLLERIEHRCAPALVADLLSVLLLDGLDASPQTVVDVPAPRAELLICAQGSHDVCCGSRGTAMAAEISAARPDVSVRRVSHTGGHRFAPTGISLPDGRMWGMFELDEMAAILDRSGSPAAVAGRCRGWTGANGPGQVAEAAVFALVDDWAFDSLDRSVIVDVDGDGWRCTVSAGERHWTVGIALGRRVPSITCGELGGGKLKPGTEYVVTSSPELVGS
ncbi:MAG: hypothetical protein HOM37_12185 [Acidimicrobiaceae bacterium]|nr:hypothetical protein [Acidimicrobiaceae bacterium]